MDSKAVEGRGGKSVGAQWVVVVVKSEWHSKVKSEWRGRVGSSEGSGKWGVGLARAVRWLT